LTRRWPVNFQKGLCSNTSVIPFQHT